MQSRYENELRDQERNYLSKLRDLESKVQALSSDTYSRKFIPIMLCYKVPREMRCKI